MQVDEYELINSLIALKIEPCLCNPGKMMPAVKIDCTISNTKHLVKLFTSGLRSTQNLLKD